MVFSLIRFFLILISFAAFLSADEKVVLQLKWLHQFQFAGYYAALEKGFYKDVGLDVEIRQRDLSKNNIDQVIDEEANYGIADSVLLLYLAKHEPIKIVAPIFQHSPNVLITLKSSGLDSPYKLKDKKLLFYKNDSDGFNILAMLKSIHIHPTMLRSKIGGDYTYLANKEVDAYTAYLTNEPYYFKEKNIPINILNPANYGIDLYGDILFTNDKEAKEHPKRVERFKQASIKGWNYALDHKEEILELIHKKYAPNKSIEHLRFEADALEQMIQHKAIPVGTIDPGRVQYALELYKKFSLIDNNASVNDYIFEPIDEKQFIHSEDKNFLTQEEKDYLHRKKVLKMCIDPKWMPFEKNDNGKHVGMSADYIHLFEKYIGTPVQMVPTKTWDESLKIGRERKCDIFSLVMPTKERRGYLDFTKPYLSVPLVIVTNLDELFIPDITKVTDRKLGIVHGYAYAEILRERYPKMKLVDVKNVKEGLEKVKEGKLFGFIGTLAATGYHIQKEYVGQLKIAGKFDDKWELGIGVRNDEPILKDIFNKAIALVPTATRQEILNKWISVNYEKGVDYDLLSAWIGGIVAVFSIIMLVIMLSNRRLSLEIKHRKGVEAQLHKMSTVDDMTQIYNRRYFNDMCPRLINTAKRESTTICFALMDVDYFKQYNDTYGHLAGDEVLKRIARALDDALQRGDDYCFRLGGEEFGIIFKGLNMQEAKVFIDKVRQEIEGMRIKHETSLVNDYVTASFGLLVENAKSVESCEEFYKEADDLLYVAKASGRNLVCTNA